MNFDAIRAEVERVAPRFAGRPTAFLGEGMDSRTYRVGDDYVFGFAKHAGAGAGLERQAAILPRLSPTLPMAVPDLEYHGRVAATGLPFVGYRMIPGVPFDRRAFEGLTPADRARAMADLAGLLRAVHAFPVAEAEALGAWPGYDRAHYAANLEEARATIWPRLDGEVRRRVDAELAAFVAEEAHFARPRCLIHGDIWPEHVLFDPAAGRIVGVIDWADISIGDPDFDLAFLAARLGPRFVAAILPHLDHPDPGRLPAKLEGIGLFNAIEDAASGIERGDDDLIAAGLGFLAGTGPMRTG